MTVTAIIQWTASDYANQRPDGAVFRFRVDTESELPTVGVLDGDSGFTVDTGHVYIRTGGAWDDTGSSEPHASTHENGGTDEVALDASQITTGVLAMARLATGTPDGTKFVRDDGALAIPSAGGAAWGGITGTLSSQTDLQTALDGKQVAGTYATGTGSASGANTGDNATNTQYSGLAASKQDTLVSATNIKTINGTTLLGSGDLVVSGGSSQLIVPLHSDASANVTMTNQANAEQFLGNSNRNITRVDLTNYTQYRLCARIVTGTASVNTPRIYAQFHTSFTTTVATFSPLGDSGDVNVSLTTAGHVATAWTNLATAAKADVFLTVMQNGGDAAADPAVAQVVIQFK